ncbi:Cleavage stimulation factor subunit 2 tau variant [Papilio xuthus]|uniref:Cleavage stimulation factor subunit 2 tau variant n=1 Tax=Papilio xuthus TaxID=66420 RepID=A0A194Q3N8_PAPXU|nr:Cleavage stimulation factor subunit 2 tau variant [Papilio xuthus]
MAGMDVDLRSARAPVPPLLDQDMRSLPPAHPAPHPVPPPLNQDNMFPRDPRLANAQGFNADPRVRPNDPRTQNKMPRNMFPRDPRLANAQGFNADPRVRPNDPRTQNKMPQQMPPGMPSMAQARTIQGIPSGASDQEKAALIMQVLQLSDEQIALLPPEQRASILMLKEQIAKSTQQR